MQLIITAPYYVLSSVKQQRLLSCQGMFWIRGK